MKLPRWLGLWMLLSVLASIDVGLTLRGQSARYWQGDYASVQELNPLGRCLLRWHPLALGLSALLECVVLGLFLLLWPTRLVVRLTLLLAFLHTLGAAGWMLHSGWLGWVVACGFLFVAKRLLAPCGPSW
jgi:hypothetical protein